jgi:hypothetical protein
MIMTQEKGFLKAQELFERLQEVVEEALQNQQRIDLVERDLMQHLLQLGFAFLQVFVARSGAGDVGATTTPPGDTEPKRRLPEQHERRYVSIFGELQIRRWVYGSREGQKIAYVPLDERLGLPAGDFSYVLEDWSQRLCVKEAFAEAAQGLETLLGLRLSVRSLEAMNRRLDASTEVFRAQQAPPPLAEEGALVVVTSDGKGVPLRRPVPAAPVRHQRRTKGEKANKKQMAYVGAVYTIDPFVRSADDVLDEVLRHERARGRPTPQHKRVWAEMTRAERAAVAGLGNGKDALFGQLSDDLVRRNRQVRRPVIFVSDGERALWEKQREYFPWAIGVLDIFHVLERLWLAAHCLHPEGSAAAESYVTERFRSLLEGKVKSVIAGLRTQARQQAGAKRRTLRRAANYFANNQDHMKYHEYLAQGFPIGSGVAEGACRHVVKDRMEQSGMRWTVAGAQAMLHTRAIYLNGDWEAFHGDRITREQTELYATAA